MDIKKIAKVSCQIASGAGAGIVIGAISNLCIGRKMSNVEAAIWAINGASVTGGLELTYWQLHKIKSTNDAANAALNAINSLQLNVDTISNSIDICSDITSAARREMAELHKVLSESMENKTNEENKDLDMSDLPKVITLGRAEPVKKHSKH